MKKNIFQLNYDRLFALYRKLNRRLNLHFTHRRFMQMSKHKQFQLIARIEKLRRKLLKLEYSIKLSGAALVLGVTLNSQQVNAQTTTQGTEFRVNNYTTGAQNLPSIAMEDNGNFIITWYSNGQDGSGTGVYAQRYNASGVAQGSQFLVNTYTTGGQFYPSVAMDDNGNFVITWISDAQDGSDFGIYGQRYDAAGVAQGLEFRVNTYTTNRQYAPSAAMDADGDFVITWHSYGQDGGFNGIYAQRYNATGVTQGTEFRVNSFVANSQFNPIVAMDTDGDFVITWIGDGQDGSNYGVYAQRYNASGVAQGSEFRVNTHTTDRQTQPSVDMDDSGNFVISWQSNTQDGSGEGVYAQRYNASGVAQGTEFLVNTYTTNNQRYSAVSMDSNGDFVIAWEAGSAQDGNGAGIYAQRFNASGVPQGTEFRVNTYTTSTQWFPAVVMENSGDFVIAWESRDQDGDNYGIYAQRYGLPLASEPTVASSSSSVGSISTNSMTINWTNGDGSTRIVLVKVGSAVDSEPTDANTYTANATFGSGSEIGTGNYVVYAGTGNSITITGLTPGTTYYYEIFEFNGVGNKTNYLTSSTAAGSQSTDVNTSTTNSTIGSTISVYPNPCKDYLQVEMEGQYSIRVLDLSGHILMKEDMLDNNKFNIQELKGGIFILEVIQNGHTLRNRIVVEQ